MPLPDSSEIETALITLLQADATLATLLPDGVFFDVGPPGATRFIVVSLIDPQDRSSFGMRAMERNLYLVKGVALSTAITGAEMKAAAYRIDVLLQDQGLVVPGYVFSAMYRDEDQPRVRTTEPDDLDPALRWYHRGGFYRVEVATPD